MNEFYTEVNGFYEAAKGLTDLPIAAVTLIFGILSLTRKNNKQYALMFFNIAAAAVLGAAVHIFDFGELLRKLIWIPLYFLLFEAVRRFTRLFSEYIKRESVPKSKLISTVELITYICTVVFLLTLDNYDMLFLLLFAVTCLVKIIVTVAAARCFPRKCIAFAVGIPLILIFQGFSEYIPYAIVYEHLIITALLFIVYTFQNEKQVKA